MLRPVLLALALAGSAHACDPAALARLYWPSAPRLVAGGTCYDERTQWALLWDGARPADAPRLPSGSVVVAGEPGAVLAALRARYARVAGDAVRDRTWNGAPGFVLPLPEGMRPLLDGRMPDFVKLGVWVIPDAPGRARVLFLVFSALV